MKNQLRVYLILLIAFLLLFFFIKKSNNSSTTERIYRYQLTPKALNTLNVEPYRIYNINDDSLIYLYGNSNSKFGIFTNNIAYESYPIPFKLKKNSQLWYFNKKGNSYIGFDEINQLLFSKNNLGVDIELQFNRYFIWSVSFYKPNILIFFGEISINQQPCFVIYNIETKKIEKEIKVSEKFKNFKFTEGNYLIFEGDFLPSNNESIYYYSFRHSVIFELKDGYDLVVHELMDKIKLPLNKIKKIKIDNEKYSNVTTDNLKWYYYDGEIINDTLYMLTSNYSKKNAVVDVYNLKEFQYQYSFKVHSNSSISYLFQQKQKLKYLNNDKQILE